MNKSNRLIVLLIVVLLLIIANVLVYKRAKSAKYISSIPIALIDGYIETMNHPADIWLLGNSTLDNGVLIDVLQKDTRKIIIKCPIGSGTIEAMSMLALKALDKNPNKPQSICLFVTKDDFNKNGYRAEKSMSYIDIMTHIDLQEKILSELPLYSYRLSLRHDILRKILKEDDETESTGNTEGGDGVKDYTDYKTAYLTNLGKNYELNFNSLKELSDLCNRKNITLYVIMPPVTNAIEKWQNFYFPKRNYAYVIDSAHKKCEQTGVNFYNFSDSIPSTTSYFKDVYHLNKEGANIFTKLLIPIFKKAAITEK